ncbi:hypothetical protein JW872_01680 [Candidatus Babeliales bacterium]|nr:hypothetical protein [Candidatus Babeliales bacterium]
MSFSRVLLCIVLSFSFFSTGHAGDETPIQPDACDLYFVLCKTKELATDDPMQQMLFFQAHPELPAAKFDCGRLASGMPIKLDTITEEEMVMFPLARLMQLQTVRAIVLATELKDNQAILQDGTSFTIPVGYMVLLAVLCVREDMNNLLTQQNEPIVESSIDALEDQELGIDLNGLLDAYFDENSQPLQTELPWYKMMQLRVAGFLYNVYANIRQWWHRA